LEQSKVLISPRKVNTGARLLCVLFIGASLAWPAASAKTYRWVDESGEVVYSQFPPPPGTAVDTLPPPPPPAEPDAGRELRETLQRLEDSREDRELARERADEEAAQARQQARGCAAAEQNIQVYRDSPPNRLIRDSSGEYRRVTPEQREAKIREAQDYLDRHCR
jgi:hypothetical protein